MNVHVEYTDGKYANISQVVSDLAYVGVTHVRDATLIPTNQGQSSYDALATAGIKFDLFVQGRDIGPSLSLLGKFARAHPGAVEAIEGPNEINNFPVAYSGLTGAAAGLAYQSALYRGVSADPVLSGTPVFSLTDNAYFSATADFSNVHPYPHEGAQPYPVLADTLARQLRAAPGKPVVMTETGYYSLPNGVGWGGVDLQTHAKLTINLLLDAAKLGYRKTYIYQLLDAYPDPTNRDQERHFGFFDIGNNAKPVATALHNLSAILKDDGATGSTFAVGALPVQITGLPSSGFSLVLQKSSGAFDVVVWNEPQVWDNARHAPIATGSSTITVDFGGRFAHVTAYDPLTGLKPVAAATAADRLQLPISDRPLVIEVSGPLQAAGRARPAL
ncbi:hypothetical protein DJ021_13680 [Phenylobacterium hankyongense]|uniref:Calcium-binding protein n=1 Tax=Phenylobacterium hankyongense TaxID=1813876 RepID=A0A328B2Y0_9CAUL|nr:hypothetical protein DJ021_13680 [Phenylobacterium hankyongense]